MFAKRMAVYRSKQCKRHD